MSKISNMKNQSLNKNNKYQINNANLIARKYLAESVYHMTKLDGLNTTMFDTKNLVDVGIINNMNTHDVTVINNLSKAWKFVVSDHGYDVLSLEFLKKLNDIVGKDLVLDHGSLRTGKVSIGEHTPDIPIEENVEKNIEDLKEIKDPINLAISIITNGIKNQYFYDGNKRTSFMLANSILIQNNVGIIVIEDIKYPEFNTHLTKLLSENNEKDLSVFLKEKCINYQPTYQQELDNEKDEAVLEM